MIKNQTFEILTDDERERSSLFIYSDPTACQTYQVSLIDAWIGLSDYMPDCQYMIVPLDTPKQQGQVFRDTFLIEHFELPDEIRVLLVECPVIQQVFDNVGDLVDERDVIACLCERELVKSLKLQLIGVFHEIVV